MIELGDEARDTLTGFTGIAVGYATHLYNCDRVGLKPRELKDGKPADNLWFDITSLELVAKNVVSVVPAEPVPFNMLDQVKDSLTSYEGVITGFIFWISGCTRATVQSRAMKDGHPVDDLSFPVQQLVLVQPTAEPVKRTGGGGPMKAPTAMRDPR